MALDEFRSSLQREGQSVLAQIPRPMELLPKPDRDTIYDSLSATNPICDYFIGCYVRPVFSNASSSFQETGKERNRL